MIYLAIFIRMELYYCGLLVTRKLQQFSSTQRAKFRRTTVNHEFNNNTYDNTEIKVIVNKNTPNSRVDNMPNILTKCGCTEHILNLSTLPLCTINNKFSFICILLYYILILAVNTSPRMFFRLLQERINFWNIKETYVCI